jgi:CrcB protein
MTYVCIAAGGVIGAITRYISIHVIQTLCSGSFPVGTFLVNSAGSLIAGFLYMVFETLVVPARLRLFLITGFLGSYTTFSTYALETAQCVAQGRIKEGLVNIGLHTAAGPLCALGGIKAGALLLGSGLLRDFIK